MRRSVAMSPKPLIWKRLHKKVEVCFTAFCICRKVVAAARPCAEGAGLVVDIQITRFSANGAEARVGRKFVGYFGCRHVQRRLRVLRAAGYGKLDKNFFVSRRQYRRSIR